MDFFSHFLKIFASSARSIVFSLQLEIRACSVTYPTPVRPTVSFTLFCKPCQLLASEMTYTVSGGALNSAQPNPTCQNAFKHALNHINMQTKFPTIVCGRGFDPDPDQELMMLPRLYSWLKQGNIRRHTSSVHKTL